MNNLSNPTVPQRKRGGRPANPDGKQCRSITAHFSQAEYDMVMSKIHTSGLRKSEAGRLLFLHQDLPKKVPSGVHRHAAQLYAKLQPLQSNINQIAHHLNRQKPTNLNADAIRKITKLVLAAEKTIKDFRNWVVTHQPNINSNGA